MGVAGLHFVLERNIHCTYYPQMPRQIMLSSPRLSGPLSAPGSASLSLGGLDLALSKFISTKAGGPPFK